MSEHPFRQRATGKWSDCHAGNHRDPHAKGCCAMLPAEYVFNRGKRRWHDERSTDSLHGARRAAWLQ